MKVKLTRKITFIGLNTPSKFRKNRNENKNVIKEKRALPDMR